MALEKSVLSELAVNLDTSLAIRYLERLRPLMLPELNPDIDNALELVYKRIAIADNTHSYVPDTVFYHVCKCVSGVTGIENIHLTTTRLRAEVIARQYVMYFTLIETEAAKRITLTSLAHMFKRQYAHCYVVYARKVLTNLYQTDKAIHGTMLKIATALSIMGYTRSLQHLNNMPTPFIYKTSKDV